MHTLIGRLGAIQGVDRMAAAVRSTTSRSDRAPGARAAAETPQTNSNSGDIRIAAAGSSLREVPTVAGEALGYACHMAGENAVGNSVGAVPGRFV